MSAMSVSEQTSARKYRNNNFIGMLLEEQCLYVVYPTFSQSLEYQEW